MLILALQTAHAIFAGKADPKWLAEKSQQAVKWVQAKLLDVVDFVRGIGRWVKGAAGGFINFMRGWFRDDPVGATAGVVLVLVVGAVVVSGGSVIGALGAAALGTGGLFLRGIASLGKAGWIVAGLGTLLGFVVKNVIGLWNFDWKIKPEDIRKAQVEKLKNFALGTGDAVGQALGGLICGIKPEMAGVKIDVEFAASLWRAYDEEVRDEIADALSEIVAMAAYAAKQIAFLEVYKNVRSWILSDVTGWLPGDLGNALRAWLSPGEAWSFAKEYDNRLQTIKDEDVREWVEEAFDAAFDICSEVMWARV